MKKQNILLLLVITIVVGCRTGNEINDTTLFYSECQTIIDSIYLANPKSVGIMVHIESPKNNHSWSGCSGYPNKEREMKLTPHQPALIASSIKPYVSSTILRLQELGSLTIEDSISRHLSKETIELFEKVGYDFDNIKIKHLLSHTSGIKNYVDPEYLEWINLNQQHRWTRNEQLKLAASKGKPLGDPEDVFSYTDTNYLLCTEIIESNSQKPFYTAMRNLLKYEKLGFKNTWFPTLENPNPNTKPMVHQYWGKMNWDSHEQDISYDLYGGGGIATTTKDLANFSYNLFQGKIIEDSTTLNKIFTKITPANGEDTGYFLGLREGISSDYKYYCHGGFWGTSVFYLPELETAIAVYILEKDEFHLISEVSDIMVSNLAKELNMTK
jgi:D-alanyl-D-alanine carboxypeptidase